MASNHPVRPDRLSPDGRAFPGMQILIWPGHHDPLDAAIKFFTHGRGSHAAFLRLDGCTVHEAFWPAVRDRPLTVEDCKLVEVYHLAGLSDTHHLRFERLFDSNLRQHIKYSFLDLVRFALNRPNPDERHTFCSRYVMHCCEAILPVAFLPLVRLPYRDWASPRDLRISPRLILAKEYFASPNQL